LPKADNWLTNTHFIGVKEAFYNPGGKPFQAIDFVFAKAPCVLIFSNFTVSTNKLSLFLTGLVYLQRLNTIIRF